MKRLDFFSNSGGLNITDSPFIVSDNQATGGYNYDYLRTGAIAKRRGHFKMNSTPSTALYTLGMGQFNPASGTRLLLRAADRVLQTVTTDDATVVPIAEDTAAVNTSFFAASSTQPVSFSIFNTTLADATWFAGGGASTIYGFNGTKVTANGVAAPTGTFTAVVSAPGAGGIFDATGAYYYAIALHKASTSTLSNVSLDQLATITDVTETVTLTFPAGIDTTKYDFWYIYRSAVTGFSGFTTGDLVATLATTAPNFVDTGDALAVTQNVPRAGSLVLDNSQLPTGTYNTITTFKRRLIACNGSTIRFSDLDKPESWPINNFITIPTGGDITAAAVIGYNAYFSGNTDEYLVIFKDRELWVVTGEDPTSWILKFIDSVGCAAQRLAVPANGYVAWIDYRGIYLWSGSGKPIYVSRPIESLFSFDGDLDKPKLRFGWGRFFRKQNQIIWFMSHRTQGEQAIAIKLDVRLTVPRATEQVDQKVIEGVFSLDSQIGLYGGESFVTTNESEEQFYASDINGFIYRLYYGGSDAGQGIDFSYFTRHIDLGSPAVAKRIYKVVLYTDELAPWDISLDYWSQYRVDPLESSTRVRNIDPSTKAAPALWDIAVWDVSYWDLYQAKVKSLVYHLDPNQGNNEGDAIRLKFYNINANEPITIHGFSVFFDEIEVRK